MNTADTGRDFQAFGLTSVSAILRTFAAQELNGPINVRINNDIVNTVNAVVTIQESDDGTTWTTGYSNGNSGTGVQSTVTVAPGGVKEMIYVPSKSLTRIVGTGAGLVYMYTNMMMSNMNEMLDSRIA